MNDYKGLYFTTKLEKRNYNNNIFNIKRDFYGISMHCLNQFRVCLNSKRVFDTTSYDEYIENMTHENSVGQELFELMTKAIELKKTLKEEIPKEFNEITDSINQRLKQQNTYVEKIKSFLEKVLLLKDYTEKDELEKYCKEIVAIFSD